MATLHLKAFVKPNFKPFIVQDTTRQENDLDPPGFENRVKEIMKEKGYQRPAAERVAQYEHNSKTGKDAAPISEKDFKREVKKLMEKENLSEQEAASRLARKYKLGKDAGGRVKMNVPAKYRNSRFNPPDGQYTYNLGFEKVIDVPESEVSRLERYGWSRVSKPGKDSNISELGRRLTAARSRAALYPTEANLRASREAFKAFKEAQVRGATDTPSKPHVHTKDCDCGLT